MCCGVILTGQKRKSGCQRPADYVSGVAPGPYSAESLLESLYSANPEAVINGRLNQYRGQRTGLTILTALGTRIGTSRQSNTVLESRLRGIRCGNQPEAVSPTQSSDLPCLTFSRPFIRLQPGRGRVPHHVGSSSRTTPRGCQCRRR